MGQAPPDVVGLLLSPLFLLPAFVATPLADGSVAEPVIDLR